MELKRCSYCGQPAETEKCEEWPYCAKEPKIFWDTGCDTVDCRGARYPEDSFYTSKEESETAWNTRPVEDELQQDINFKAGAIASLYDTLKEYTETFTRLSDRADALAARIEELEQKEAVFDGEESYTLKEMETIWERFTRLKSEGKITCPRSAGADRQKGGR